MGDLVELADEEFRSTSQEAAALLVDAIEREMRQRRRQVARRPTPSVPGGSGSGS